MRRIRREDLICDWNTLGARGRKRPARPIWLNDETLRDGLQSPSVRTPSIEEKVRILHLMEELGIYSLDIGLPGAGEKAREHVLALAKEIARAKLKILPNCAARTLETDIAPVVEVSQKVGIPVEAAVFLGSSPIRQYAEDWTVREMLRHTRRAVKFAAGHGLPVMYVTEDTTRADPKTIRALYLTAIECGAQRICVCDTAGHATPDGVRGLIRFVRKLIGESGRRVTIDWHGHRDRALDIPNAFAAIEAGAHRIHGCGLGIGERAGNCSMDHLLVNLRLLGWIENDLRRLREYCHEVSRSCEVPIPSNYPVFGKDAFETATGVHAAAVIKAFRKGDAWLADRVYSGVPAGDFGMEQRIRVGPMSGRSNVAFWLEKNGYGPSDELVQEILGAAKRSERLLEDRELHELARKHSSAHPVGQGKSS